jgi:hypothetical protein
MQSTYKTQLEANIATLNKEFGFGKGPRVGAGGKMLGKGFILYSAYGKAQLQFTNYNPGSGYRADFTGLHTPSQLIDITAYMIRTIRFKKTGRFTGF